jgi:hypothetical protein
MEKRQQRQVDVYDLVGVRVRPKLTLAGVPREVLVEMAKFLPECNFSLCKGLKISNMTWLEIAEYCQRFNHLAKRKDICERVNIVRVMSRVYFRIDCHNFVAKVANEVMPFNQDISFKLKATLKDMDFRASCDVLLTDITPIPIYGPTLETICKITQGKRRWFKGDVLSREEILLDASVCEFEMVYKKDLILHMCHSKVQYEHDLFTSAFE